MQKLTIIGNIGKDAELKEINSQFLIQFSVAVNNGYYNQEGSWVDRTNWYNCKIWKDKSQKTDVVKKLLKGRKIYVEGIPDISIYKGNDNTTRIDLGIKVSFHEFLETIKKEENNQPVTDTTDASTTIPTTNTDDVKDDLPF